jgi:Carbohydrate binding domain
MGRGPFRHPPRHLAPARRSSTDAREHAAAEWALAAVAIVLTAAVVIGSMFQHPGARDPGPAGDRPPATPTTASAPAATAGGGATGGGAPAAAGNLVADPGFEAGLAGWLGVGGTRVERSGPARAGSWAGRFAATGLRDQGMALPRLSRCTPGRTYAAAVWVMASRPATVVEVTLLEVAGRRRLAADTVGAVLQAGQWQRVEVTHDAHRAGTALALEVVLPAGSAPATVMVDDLQVTAGRP